MATGNFGSIGIEHFYRLPHLVAPGGMQAVGLGGNGGNPSVAAARAGARVLHHIDALGATDAAVVERLAQAWINTTHGAQLPGVTGHAIINIDPAGENRIVLHPGANLAMAEGAVTHALEQTAAGDKSAALPSVAAVRDRQRGGEAAAARRPRQGWRIRNGHHPRCRWRGRCRPPPFEVQAVDSSGAGDCFTGKLAAALESRVARSRHAARRCRRRDPGHAPRHCRCHAHHR